VLTAAGEQQAQRTALHLAAGLHLHATIRDAVRPVLDRLYCSAMIRAMQTAQPIGEALGVRPEVWIDIHEIGGIFLDRGERKIGYPGQTRSQLAKHFPNCILPSQVSEQGWWNRDFEEIQQGYNRAADVAQTLRQRAGEDVRIGLVSHGDFLSALLQALGDQLPGEGAYYEHRNTGITHIDLTPQRTRVCYLNRVDHLAEALMTY
jgi:broad specificity phosphatase PhoE